MSLGHALIPAITFMGHIDIIIKNIDSQKPILIWRSENRYVIIGWRALYLVHHVPDASNKAFKMRPFVMQCKRISNIYLVVKIIELRLISFCLMFFVWAIVAALISSTWALDLGSALIFGKSCLSQTNVIYLDKLIKTISKYEIWSKSYPFLQIQEIMDRIM